MRIALHDYGAYPFTAELARELARRGHAVRYYYGTGFRQPRAEVASTKGVEGLEFVGVDVASPYQARAGLRRVMQERRYGELVGQEIREFAPDVVLSANAPLEAQVRISRASRVVRAAFVFWMQDIYSRAIESMLARRITRLGARVVAKRYELLERRILVHSDAVILIAEDFRRTLTRWGVSAARTRVIENWSPLDEVQPRQDYAGWGHVPADAVVFLYAGTLGRKHDPTLLAHLAAALPDALVVVVADGVHVSKLRKATGELANLRVLPLQPAKDLPAILARADVLLAILAADADEFSVPSKVLTYLAAGRPILAAMPTVNLAARTILKAGAGIVVGPDDITGFLAGAAELRQDSPKRDAMGRSGRAYAEQAFRIGAKADAMEDVLHLALESARETYGTGGTMAADG
jgi:glycosyltransferase involved in cell wall biosynthesis